MSFDKVNLFILAAGVGSRLMPLTKDKPKSLIPLGDGTTLLERQIATALASESIDKVFIVTGYRSEQIEAKVREIDSENRVNIIFNPFYEISNNLMSVWCCIPYFADKDFIISNGDNIYNSSVFPSIFSQVPNREGIFLTLNEKSSFDDDDMKVTIENGSIKFVNKKIPLQQCNAESVGLSLVIGEASRKSFVTAVATIAKEKESLNRFWLEIFNFYVSNYKGLVQPVWIKKDDWREMDFHPDIEIIQKAMDEKLF